MNELVPIEDLNPAIQITALGLQLPTGLDVLDWKKIGHALLRRKECIQWWIGDWINYAQVEYGKKYENALEEFNNEANAFGYTEGTLRNFASIAGKFDLSSRRDNLSFKHHTVLAKLGAKERNKWLDKASQENWSSRDLNESIRETGADKKAKISHAPPFSLVAKVDEIVRHLKSEDFSTWETARLDAAIEELNKIVSIQNDMKAEIESRK